MKLRIFIIIFVFFGVYGLVGHNLYRLQVEEGISYFEKVQARNEALAEMEARRGKIFITDRNGNRVTVAMSRDLPMIHAVPRQIRNPDETAGILAEKFGLDKESLEIALSNKRSLHRIISHKASKEEVEWVRNSNIEGVYVGERQYRYYPFEGLLSHVTGFLGINENVSFPKGLYGIERFYEERLREGEDIELTIDRSIQSKSEEILGELIERYDATGGTVIVQDPVTGGIIAMANQPSFDPNDYYDFPVGSFVNPAVQYIYEPGSVFKAITLASGIDAGVLNAETKYKDTGSVTLSGRMIRNWDNKVYGEVSMRDVHGYSINTGAVFAGRLLGRQAFLEYVKRFGFGEKTGIDLPNESAGDLRSLENKHVRDIDFATAAFGQGPAVTPIQAVNAFSVIANKGLLMRPYLNKENEPYVIRRVISEEAANEIKSIMVDSVARNIIGAIPGYEVAGKTGTASIPDFQRGGYTDDLIHTFIGFAPASDPKFTILIKIDKPQTVGVLAGRTVVPAFRELAQFIINYYNIPPDQLE